MREHARSHPRKLPKRENLWPNPQIVHSALDVQVILTIVMALCVQTSSGVLGVWGLAFLEMR